MKIAVCNSNKTILLNKTLFKLIKKNKIKSKYNWAEKFCLYLNKYNIENSYIDIDNDDWIKRINEFDIIIWKPSFMGVRSSQAFKEKIYFIQYIMNKKIYPNYETIWHFDSKVAQKYLFEFNNIKKPNTFVTQDYNNAINIIENMKFPIVLKSSNGAGSTGVRLVSSYKKIKRYVNRVFIWNKFKAKINPIIFDRFGEIYIQEFIPNNKYDLRINIVGNKYAMGFWRKNRKNDFRASGSGCIDYQKEIPSDIIKYCCQISSKLNFDSMAYDIIFKENDFAIVEMSYGYNDNAVYNCNGYFELDSQGNINQFVEGHFWPQELWIKWVLYNQDESILNLEIN